MTTTTPTLGQCQWFALCDHDAEHLVQHPLLGNVATCRRCVDKFGLETIDPAVVAAALEVATYNPRHAIEGWHSGHQANGDDYEAFVMAVALDIQANWRRP